MNWLKKTISLIELLLSLILFITIILGVISFNILSRRMITSTERRTKVLNEAAYILDRITKDAAGAIGDVTTTLNLAYVNNPLVLTQPLRLCGADTCGNNMLLIKQDTNGNGIRDADNVYRLIGLRF
ncbi:MAG: hypothetical protein NC904_08525 [Candidatus Omnitrophica bacterium]|nr:hypothetical protein [Candidatus Omnitrophota bacterium]